MKESSKTNKVRPTWFFTEYLRGRVIDIGAGDDPVCPWAEAFDQAQGDANKITRYREPESYDAVHSSHCLEHMHDPLNALKEWWALLKPGGILIVVIPEESLFEQGHWPSLFNGDHKWTFRISNERSWSPRSIDVTTFDRAIADCEILSIDLHDTDYEHELRDTGLRRAPPVVITRLLIRMGELGRPGIALQKIMFRLMFKLGFVADQTLGQALAQIQVVMRKRKTAAGLS